MSNEHPNRDSDSRLEQELRAVRLAWSRLQHEEPPDLLDRAVLNSARRAVTHPVKRSSLRWMGGLATAAVVVMAVTIAVKQDLQGPAPPVPQTDGFELELQSAGQRDEKGIRAMDSQTTSEHGALRSADSQVPEYKVSEEADMADSAQRQEAPIAANESPAPTLQKSMFDNEAGGATPPRDIVGEADEAALDAEVWVEHLLQLKRDGRLQQLGEELEAFRRAYPDFELPPELLE